MVIPINDVRYRNIIALQPLNVQKIKLGSIFVLLVSKICKSLLDILKTLLNKVIDIIKNIFKSKCVRNVQHHIAWIPCKSPLSFKVLCHKILTFELIISKDRCWPRTVHHGWYVVEWWAVRSSSHLRSFLVSSNHKPLRHGLIWSNVQNLT